MSRRLIRPLAPLALVLGMALLSGSARGQAPEQKGFFDVPAPEAPSATDPWYGYVAMAFLGAGAIFAVCKSARR
jgi:hypothetical protein